jgi:Spy/CpxP family protein refolding chaperone
VSARAGALAVALAAIAVTARAQGPSPEAPPPGGPREEAARMVDAYVLSNLQESLSLSDDQFVRLLPLVKRLQAERREAMDRRARAVREMRRLLKSGSATEPEVLAQLKEWKAIEADDPLRGRKGMEAIDALLTPLQQAKFRVFEADVSQKLRELTGQMRRQNRGESRPEPGKPRRPDQP